MTEGNAPNIADEVPCAECGYTLREPDADGQCPECGHPIADSIVAARRWPMARRRAVMWMSRALAVAFAAHWMLLAAIVIAMLVESTRLGRTVAWLDSLVTGALLLFVPIHLIACWIAGESALEAHTATPGGARPLSWRWLVRVPPIPAIGLMLFGLGTLNETLIAFSLVLFAVARAAALTATFDVIGTAASEGATPVARIAIGAKEVATAEGVVLGLAPLALLFDLLTTGSLTLISGIAAGLAAIVSTVSLIVGTVAAINGSRSLRRDVRRG